MVTASFLSSFPGVQTTPLRCDATSAQSKRLTCEHEVDSDKQQSREHDLPPPALLRRWRRHDGEDFRAICVVHVQPRAFV
jgi:hypothetical protein